MLLSSHNLYNYAVFKHKKHKYIHVVNCDIYLLFWTFQHIFCSASHQFCLIKVLYRLWVSHEISYQYFFTKYSLEKNHTHTHAHGILCGYVFSKRQKGFCQLLHRGCGDYIQGGFCPHLHTEGFYLRFVFVGFIYLCIRNVQMLFCLLTVSG